jgi:hypothetical protein
VKWWAWLLAGAVLGGLASYVAQGRARDAWDRRADSLIAVGVIKDSLRAHALASLAHERQRADSLILASQRSVARADRADRDRGAVSGRVAALRDSLAARGLAVDVRDTVIAVQDTIITLLLDERSYLRVALAEQVEAASILRRSVDAYARQSTDDSLRIADLTRLVRERPKPARCRVLVVSCETLTVAGVATAILLGVVR